MRRRILLVQGHNQDPGTLKPLLESSAEIQVDSASTEEGALRLLTEQGFSLLLLDVTPPGPCGIRLIQEIQRRNIPVTIIVLAGHGSIDQAVQTMRLGVYDFLTTPVDQEHLALVVQRALRERRLVDESSSLREQLQDSATFHNIISKNPRMHAVFELINDVAQSNTTVLIEGETGTGKERIARAIHESSQVRRGPLIAVNCAALPQHLLESELFGHEKGAFTSAINQRVGRFEMAQGGTILLDEVGDIPASMQAKLLRVLQERRFERVGGTHSIKVDVRIIGATNRSLQRLVQQEKFREDLYYRLNVVKIDLPPLRQRREDIPLLATFFARKYARGGESPKQIPAETMNMLLDHSWPGNIRELENAIERACVTSPDAVLLPEYFPPEVQNNESPGLPVAIDLNQSLPALLRQVQANIEQEYIRKALEQCRGNVSRCAQLCGISRRSLSAKLGTYQINKSVFKEFSGVD